MDDNEKTSSEVKDVPGFVTLVLSEEAANKLLESASAQSEVEDDVSGFMLNMGFGGAARLNATTTSTSTSPCTQTNIGNGDIKCDVDEWIQY